VILTTDEQTDHTHRRQCVITETHFISLIFDGLFSQEWHHHFAGLIITYHLLM
jgi:hypothetical protein